MVTIDFYDLALLDFFSCCFSFWAFSYLFAFFRMLRCLAILANSYTKMLDMEIPRKVKMAIFSHQFIISDGSNLILADFINSHHYLASLNAICLCSKTSKNHMS